MVKKLFSVFLYTTMGMLALLCLPNLATSCAAEGELPPEVMQTADLSIWERVQGSPATTRLFDIKIVSPTLGWAVGDEGAIWRYDGLDWDSVPSPTSYRIYSIAVVSEEEAWASGDYGTLLHYIDGVWNLWPEQMPNFNLHSLTMVSSDRGWAVGRAGAIFSFDGAQWTKADPLSNFALNSVFGVDENTAYAVGSVGTILTYQSGVWSQMPSPVANSLKAVAMTGSGVGWAVGWDGVIIYYNGATWTEVASPVDTTLNAVLIISPDDVWAAGYSGVLVHYDGTSWQEVTSPTPYSIYDLTAAENGDLWAVGFSGAVLRYDGGTWENVTRLTHRTLHDLSWDGSIAWGVGEDGAMLHYSAGQWNTVQSPLSATLYAVDNNSLGSLWAMGADGAILHNSGSGWAAVSSPTTGTLRGLAFLSATEGWAVGGDAHAALNWSQGELLHFNGASWVTDSTVVTQPLYGIDFDASGDGWAVGEHGSLWHYTGSVWLEDTFPVDNTLWAVDVLSSTSAWAVGESGLILHYRDAQWHLVDSPTDKGLHKVVMLDPTEGWIFGDAGVLLHFDGLAWREVSSVTRNQLLGADVDGSGDLWLVGNNGTLLRQSNTPTTFQLAVAAEQTYLEPQKTSLLGVSLASFGGFSESVQLDLAGLPAGISATWTLTSTPSPADLVIEFAIADPQISGTHQLTLTANSGSITRSQMISLTVLPRTWLRGPELDVKRSVYGADHDGDAGVWAVGANGLLAYYDDQGWHNYASAEIRNLYAVDALSPTLAWAAGEDGALLRFDGSAWLGVSSSVTMPLHALHISSPDLGWAVGGEGSLLRYDGLQWAHQTAPGNDWLYDVAMASDGRGWAVGWGGAIWRYDGTQWQIASSPTSSWLRALAVVSPDEAWAVGSEGAILHYTTAAGWQLFPSPTVARLLDVHFTSADEGWAVGGDGTLLYYDGTMWHQIENTAHGNLRAIGGGGADYGLVVGDSGEELCYLPASSSVSSLPGCGNTPGVWNDPQAQRLYLPLIGRSSNFKIPVDIYGVQTMGGTFSRDPAIVHQMAAAGIRWARLPFSWKLIEPQNTTPDQFHWSVYDDWLELLSLYDIQPLPFIARGPSWSGTLAVSHLDKTDVAEQNSFIAAAVSRYGYATYNTTWWALFGEPDNATPEQGEFGASIWGNDPQGYADMLARLYPLMKEANPGAQVLLGGLAHDNFVDQGGVFSRSFLTDVIKSGAANYFDVFNFHHYGDDLDKKIVYFKDFLTRMNLDKPIVCTETSLIPGDLDGEVLGERYARYLPKVMMRSFAESLDIGFWFALSDMESNWRPGLFTLERTPRPTYVVYKVLSEVFESAFFVRVYAPTENASGQLEGYVFDSFDDNAIWRLDALWTHEESVVVSRQVAAPWVHLTNKYGGTRYVYDADDGSVDGICTFDVGVNPLYVIYGQ